MKIHFERFSLTQVKDIIGNEIESHKWKSNHASRGYIYAIEIGGEKTKIGSSGDAFERIRTHLEKWIFENGYRKAPQIISLKKKGKK